MSKIATSGRVSATLRSASGAEPALPTTSIVGLGQQPREPFAQQRLVVGEHYAHGSSATRRLAVHAQHAAEGADAVVEVDQLRPGRHGGVDRHAQPAVLARGVDGGVAAPRAPPR